MTAPAAPVGAPAYLTPKQIADRLNVSVRHVYDLIAARELDSARFGQGRLGLRVPAESLAAFEQRRREH